MQLSFFYRNSFEKATCFFRIMIAIVLLLNTFTAGFAQETRPDYNKGTGFFVKNGKIYDKNGQQFIMRGINHTHWWADDAHNLEAVTSPNGIVKSNSNAVRAVFGANMGADTPSERRNVVQQYIVKQIVPIVENHDATCGKEAAQITAIVDGWLAPGNVEILKDYEDKIILNITNEWGPESAVWRDTYITAITRLRNAGVNCLIMIDAPLCGQGADYLKNDALTVLNSDPQKNIVFSIHMYGYWKSTNRGANQVGKWGDGKPWLVETELQNFVNLGIPSVVGEFSWGAEGICGDVGYATRDVMVACKNLGLGWLAWAWYENSCVSLDMLADDKWLYNSDADLTPFGQLIINDPEVGLKATAVKPNIWGMKTN